MAEEKLSQDVLLSIEKLSSSLDSLTSNFVAGGVVEPDYINQISKVLDHTKKKAFEESQIRAGKSIQADLLYAESKLKEGNILRHGVDQSLKQSLKFAKESALRGRVTSALDSGIFMTSNEGVARYVSKDAFDLKKIYEEEGRDDDFFNAIFEDVDLGRYSTAMLVGQAIDIYNAEFRFQEGPQQLGEREKFLEEKVDNRFGKGTYKAFTVPQDQLEVEDFLHRELLFKTPSELEEGFQSAFQLEQKRINTFRQDFSTAAFNASRITPQYDQAVALAMYTQFAIGLGATVLTGGAAIPFLAADLLIGVGGAVSGYDPIVSLIKGEATEISGGERALFLLGGAVPFVAPVFRHNKVAQTYLQSLSGMKVKDVNSAFKMPGVGLSDQAFEQVIKESGDILQQAGKEGRELLEILQAAKDNPSMAKDALRKMGDSPLHILTKAAVAGDEQSQRLLRSTIGKAFANSVGDESAEAVSAFSALMGKSVPLAETVIRDVRFFGDYDLPNKFVTPVSIVDAGKRKRVVRGQRQRQAEKLESLLDQVRKQKEQSFVNFEEVSDTTVNFVLVDHSGKELVPVTKGQRERGLSIIEKEITPEVIDVEFTDLTFKQIPLMRQNLLPAPDTIFEPRFTINLPLVYKVGDQIKTPAGQSFLVKEVDMVSGNYLVTNEYGQDIVFSINRADLERISNVGEARKATRDQVNKEALEQLKSRFNAEVKPKQRAAKTKAQAKANPNKKVVDDFKKRSAEIKSEDAVFTELMDTIGVKRTK